MNKHIILLFIILCIGLTRASAQHSITGKVLDATNQEPIPFASVTIKNVKSGTTTNNNGNLNFTNNNIIDGKITGTTATNTGVLEINAKNLDINLINSGTFQTQTEFQKIYNIEPTPAEVPVLYKGKYKCLKFI